jgi:hypothetical protein
LLKAKFIDKILEVMPEEADRIYITRRDIDIYFKKNTDDEGSAEISKFIQSLNLDEQVGEYRIKIDYEFKNIEIHKNNKFVCLRGFGKYGVTGIWSMILEELDMNKELNLCKTLNL